jgi:hypothetical protein
LNEGGFGLDEAQPSIDLVFAIRQAETVGRTGDYHPLAAAAMG